jgi:hypothetical protein
VSPPLTRPRPPRAHPSASSVARAAATLVVASFATLVVVEGDARAAPDRQACIDAYPEGQRLRKQGKLRGARAALLVCAQQECPQAVRQDCGRWLEELAAQMPSIVVEVRDAGGDETADARLSVDGEVVAEHLDGRAVELDPGEHVVGLVHRGATRETRLLLREGEVRRRVVVSFVPEPTPAGAMAPAVSSDATPVGPGAASPAAARSLGPRASSDRARSDTPISALVLGGVGAAALVASGVLLFDARRLYGRLESTCAPACSPDDVAPLERRQLGAGLTAGVGVVALGAAAWFFFTPSALPNVGTRTASPLALGLGPGQASLVWRGALP